MSLILVGRVIFGAFFLIAGVRNFLGLRERRTFETNYGWPLPMPLVVAGFGVQAVAGLALILGLWTVPAALALIAFLVLATALYHNPFLFQGEARQPHIYFTLVNITLAGGLLMIIGTA